MKTVTVYHTNESLEVLKIEKRTMLFGLILKRKFIKG
jgi:hypothetical protein